MKTYATFTTDLADDGLLLVTFSRPEALNSFTVEMANELIDLFESVNADDAVRVIVVTGGGRAFCAGMDLTREGNVFGLNEGLSPTLGDLAHRFEDPEIVDGVRDTGGRVTLAIFACRKPVIAAINGAAVGVGATMTLAMDFRLASEKAKIGFVFGKLGIVPEACSSWFLPRIVGLQQALEWTYTADIFGAEEAKAAGLVRSIHAPETLVEEACAFARRLVAGKSPQAIALTRQMLMRNPAFDHPREAHRIDSLAMFYTSINDGKEGVAAFREKREAKFEGKASALPAFAEAWLAKG